MASPNAKQLQALSAKKQESTAQLLFRCARLFNEIAMARVNREAGRTVLRKAHTALLPHIEFTGTRATEIAERAGITKQAVGQLLDEMEAEGVIERIPDPSDGRARLVRFTAKGAEAIMHGLSVLQALEKEFAEAIGEKQMRNLHNALAALQPALERAIGDR